MQQYEQRPADRLAEIPCIGTFEFDERFYVLRDQYRFLFMLSSGTCIMY